MADSASASNKSNKGNTNVTGTVVSIYLPSGIATSSFGKGDEDEQNSLSQRLARTLETVSSYTA